VDLGNLDQEALEKLQKPKPWTESNKRKIRRASQNITAWAGGKCLETPLTLSCAEAHRSRSPSVQRISSANP
jgi:hypothetical protein